MDSRLENASIQQVESEPMSGVNTVNHGSGVIVRAANLILGLSAGLCLGLFLLMVVWHGWAERYAMFLVLAGILPEASSSLPMFE